MKARASIVDRADGVTNGEVHLLANHGNAIQVGYTGIAASGVQILRAVNHAIHVLHGKGNAGPAVVLENRHIDDHGALARENLRNPDARRAHVAC